MVHVKKVEIFGFKSFGFKKTEVTFEPGLMSISGPNGSGKSNILDAIIFAMGENKPRMMRVDRLRALIHDIPGNKRGPLLARSSVHFDNHDRKIPLSLDTVVITREMDEGGESTYFLNGKKEARNRILSLLDMANAGIGQLNAVQQGTVTRISEFTSDERRKTIEDMIGLSYFDEQKIAAEKKLHDADQKLQISFAKMDEIKHNIDQLDEDRNQKLRYDLLVCELERYKAVAAADSMYKISLHVSDKNSKLSDIKLVINDLQSRQNAIDYDILQIEDARSKLLEKTKSHEREKAALEREISSAVYGSREYESRIESIKKRMSSIDTRLPEIDLEIKQRQSDRDMLQQSLDDTRKLVETLSVEISKIDQRKITTTLDKNKLYAQEADIAAKRDELNEKIRSLQSQRNDIVQKRGESETALKHYNDLIAKNTAKHLALTNGIELLNIQSKRLKSSIENHDSTVITLNSRIAKHTAKKNKLESSVKKLDTILDTSSHAVTKHESKLNMVKKLMHEDYSIAKLKENADTLGILGLVYEVISWNQEYERAIIAASSDWIKAIIVRDFTTMLGIGEAVRLKNLPKIKIIPLDTIPPLKISIPKGHGILGSLSDYVQCDDTYVALKTFLFGGIILTDTRESALGLSKRGYKTVTTSGEFFEARGGPIIIDINSKISKLTKLISAGSSIDELTKYIRALKRAQQKKIRGIQKIDKHIKSDYDRLALTRSTLTNAQFTYNQLQNTISSKEQIKMKLSAEIDKQSAQKAIHESDIQKSIPLIESIDQDIALVKKNYSIGQNSQIDTELREINTRLQEIDDEYNKLEQNYRNVSNDLVRLESKDNQYQSDINMLHKEIRDITSEKTSLSEQIETVTAQHASQQKVLSDLRDREQEFIATQGVSADIERYDRQLSIKRNHKDVLYKDIHSLDKAETSISRDLRELHSKQNDLQKILTVSGFKASVATFDVATIIQELQSEINTIGQLNAKAPESYLEISSGYRSMSSRKNILEGERDRIVNFINDIEKDKRQKFFSAFELVDKEIRLIFNTMTGGEAWLELQDEVDIFNSGISYLIQFPNKPKRESTSISGGEKTLAAIVFVLALQRLQPSPFYLFDEVDAHLDGPNAERLSNILAERSKQSQFLMVSLKDSVVEKAQKIYGVFPKNGVSNVIVYKDKKIPQL